MIGLIILYDHVHPKGVFIKSSHIDIKGSVKVLKEQTPTIVDNLLNALRFVFEKKFISLTFLKLKFFLPQLKQIHNKTFK